MCENERVKEPTCGGRWKRYFRFMTRDLPSIEEVDVVRSPHGYMQFLNAHGNWQACRDSLTTWSGPILVGARAK